MSPVPQHRFRRCEARAPARRNGAQYAFADGRPQQPSVQTAPLVRKNMTKAPDPILGLFEELEAYDGTAVRSFYLNSDDWRSSSLKRFATRRSI